MNEDERKTPGADAEDGALLPDGWMEGDDFFADPSTWTGSAASDGPEEAGSTDTEPGSGDAPAAGEAGETGDPGAGSETEETASNPRILKLRVNHDDQEVDVNSMSDGELIEVLQKAKAFDAVKERQATEKYRQVYQDQVRAGMTDAAARMIAANECGGKTYSLTDEAPWERDFVQEVQQLKALYPDFKETPDEVALAVADGVNLLTAYVAYREKQTQQAAAELKKENAVLKHNAASAAKAPVKGVTGGGATDTKPKHGLLAGFDSDAW